MGKITKELAEQKEQELRKQKLDELHAAHKKAGVPQADDTKYEVEDYRTPTHEKVGFSKEEAVRIFLDHRYLPRTLLAEKYGLERLFIEDRKKPANVVQRIYQHICKKPDEYAEYITEDQIKEVMARVGQRMKDMDYSNSYGITRSVKAVIATPIDDMTSKLDSIASKSANALDVKLNTLNTKKSIKDQDIKKLADTFKIMYEASRLAKGEATEHVAHLVKNEGLDQMDQADLINILNEQRESNQRSND